MDVLLAWGYGLALGAERFKHMTRYRRDPLLLRLRGLPRSPSSDTGSKNRDRPDFPQVGGRTKERIETTDAYSL